MIRGSRPQPVPPAPTELLLVTRMGDNTSPILLTDVPQPIATFNKTFELSELVGNLDGVMYLYSGEAVNVTCVSDVEEGETKYFLAYDNGEAHIGELTVEGSTLLCSSSGSGNYLFDLDFKHQNLKFFEQTNGTYAVALPWLGLDADSKVLVSVSGGSSDKTVTIHYVNNDFRAWGYAGGSIREISWFNQLLTSENVYNIISLVRKLLSLEYSTSSYSINVLPSNLQPTTVNGDWNLFTDGSPFIPLRILSRFPNGSPVCKPSFGESITLATFNRDVELEDMLNKLKIVYVHSTQDGMAVSTLSPDSAASWGTTLVFKEDGSNLLYLKMSGNKISWELGGPVQDKMYIFDIDYDGQHKKFFEVNTGNYLLEMPMLLEPSDLGTVYPIVHLENLMEENQSIEFDFYVNDDNDMLPEAADAEISEIDVNDWFNHLSGHSGFITIQSLVDQILRMEYYFPDDIDLTIAGISSLEESINGGLLNLFTDGSEYTPLVMTSRFPNGAPMKFEYGVLESGVICTFNRPFSGYEIVQKLKVVANFEGDSIEILTATKASNYFILTSSRPGVSKRFQLIINGSNLILNADYNRQYGTVYDLDFDHQFQRALPSSDFKWNVQVPQLLDNPTAGQGIGIKHLASSQNQLAVFANDSFVPYICENTTLQNQLGNWAVSLSPSDASALLQAIVAMEYEGFDETPVNIQSAAYDAGDANYFEVVPLIPQTLS